MIDGYATEEGTEKFSKKNHTAKGHFRASGDLVLSSVGVGTYLGEMDSKTDEAVH